MDTTSYKTISANKATANKSWIIIDCDGKSLGRVASLIAVRLRGKHKTNFTPHADCGQCSRYKRIKSFFIRFKDGHETICEVYGISLWTAL